MNPLEMACRVCLAPLNTAGDPPTYLHPLRLENPGHRPEPVPVGELDTVARLCDFCGDPYPVWALSGSSQIAAISINPSDQTGRLMQNFGDTWAACTACEADLADHHPDRTTDRACRTLGLAKPGPGWDSIRQLHQAFVTSRQPGRTLITTTAWPPGPIPARLLPKIRDRLAGLYRGHDRLPPALALNHARGVVADSLDRARLYWIDPQFSNIAGHAATQLPAVTLDQHLPPRPDGLLAWATPVSTQQVAAASWTSTDDEMTIVMYRAIGADLPERPLQRLRNQIGWLTPIRVARARPGHTQLDATHPLAALVSTWLLIAQQIATETPADIDKATRAHYRRQHRPPPDVRVVQLRPPRPTPGQAPHPPSPATHAGRAYTIRFWVSGHWRNQPYGPGRTLRRPVYINPFLRGPHDAPIKASTTVRALTQRPTADER